MTLAQGYLHMKIKTCFSQKQLGHFQPNFVCMLLGTRKMKNYEYDAGHTTKMTTKPIYGMNTYKIFFQGTSGQISTKLGLKHQRLELIMSCLNNNPGLILTYFTARSNFATSTFIWENVTMIDSLEIFASCDLEFG